MRIIMTGGTGLIGRTLGASLVKDGHEVIALSRNPAGATDLPSGVGAVAWDARTASGWGHLADGAFAIVNLAGESLASGRWSQGRKHRIRNSRVHAGNAVVEAVRSASRKPTVVIQSSGIGYYGHRGDEIITEEDHVGDDFLAQICVDWEGATAPIDEMGIRRPVIRSGVVFSPDALAFKRMTLPFKLFVGGRIGSGRQWLAWVHVVDHVRALRFLMDHPDATGPFNVCAPEPVQYAQFARIAGHVMNRPSLMPVPAFALRLLFGEMATVLLEGQRAIPDRLNEFGFEFTYPNLESALRDLIK
jgi:uncharacterized protein (TIGR01777 family)